MTTLAGDADVPDVVRRAVSSAGSRAHHTSRAIAERFTHRDDDRCGARWPCQSSLRDAGRADIRVAPWELRGALLVRDRCPPGTFRSPMTGRASSSDDAARTRGATSRRSRSGRGVHSQCAYRAPRLGISTQGPARGLARITARGPDPVHSRYGVILALSRSELTPKEPVEMTRSLAL